MTAFQSASGWMNLFTPTSAVVMGGLALARVGDHRFIRFMAPLLGILFVMTLAFVAIGAAVEVSLQERRRPDPSRMCRVRPSKIRRGLGPGLVDEVERRLGRPAEAGEAGVGRDPADRRLAGLGAERVAAVLGQRVRHAESVEKL